MTEAQRKIFLERVQRFGQDPDIIAQQGEQKTVQRIDKLDDLRELLGPEDEEVRRIRGFNSFRPPRTEPPDEVDLVYRFLFANGTLSPEVREFVEESFLPVDVQIHSQEDITLERDQIWDLGVSAAPQIHNLGNFVMKPGSQVRAHGTTVRFMCARLERQTA